MVPRSRGRQRRSLDRFPAHQYRSAGIRSNSLPRLPSARFAGARSSPASARSDSAASADDLAV
jgi:hypothetical protein